MWRFGRLARPFDAAEFEVVDHMPRPQPSVIQVAFSRTEVERPPECVCDHLDQLILRHLHGASVARERMKNIRLLAAAFSSSIEPLINRSLTSPTPGSTGCKLMGLQRASSSANCRAFRTP